MILWIMSELNGVNAFASWYYLVSTQPHGPEGSRRGRLAVGWRDWALFCHFPKKWTHCCWSGLFLWVQLKIILLKSFFCLRGRFPFLPWDFLYFITMILQRIRIIVGDAGFEPGTSAPEVWCATNEPPHVVCWHFCHFVLIAVKLKLL